MTLVKSRVGNRNFYLQSPQGYDEAARSDLIIIQKEKKLYYPEKNWSEESRY